MSRRAPPVELHQAAVARLQSKQLEKFEPGTTATRRLRSGSLISGLSGKGGGVIHTNRHGMTKAISPGQLADHRDGMGRDPASGLGPLHEQMSGRMAAPSRNHPANCAEARIEMAASLTVPRDRRGVAMESGADRVLQTMTPDGGYVVDPSTREATHINECSNCKTRREHGSESIAAQIKYSGGGKPGGTE